VRPSIETQWPDARVFAHLDAEHCTLYIDSSGEPLFKRGWRQDKGDAPLKETLAAAMLAASGWWNPERGEVSQAPLYDPCCGSGTIAIEAAQIARRIAPGGQRRFGFEKLLPFQAHVWQGLKAEAQAAVKEARSGALFGSDVSHRMVDFAERNAERAGVAGDVQFRGGDALQRMPPAESGVIMLNPPYGERIEVGGVARGRGSREQAQTEDGGEFFVQLASHWKRNYAGWTAWVLTPDLQLPRRMRLKESRRVPMWNGPIECRLFRFDMVAGSARGKAA
jgi:putative N6-adenine-specific DNA methylase